MVSNGVIVTIFFTCLVACEASFSPNVTTECAEKNKVKMEEIKENLKKEKHPEPTENVLCFMKCVAFGNGLIDGEGAANSSKIETEVLKNLKPEEKTKATECVKKVPKVVECKDIMALTKCVPDSVFGEHFGEEAAKS